MRRTSLRFCLVGNADAGSKGMLPFKKQVGEKNPLRLSGPMTEDARESHRWKGVIYGVLRKVLVA